MCVMPCIAPSNTQSPLRASKAIWNPIISFTPSSLGYCQQTLNIHVFMYNPHHLYHFPQPKLQQKWKTNKQMGKKSKLVMFWIRDHMHLFKNPSLLLSDHAVWTHCDVRCFKKQTNKQKKSIITMIQPWKTPGNPGSVGCFMPALGNHPDGFKNSSHWTHQWNPSS